MQDRSRKRGHCSAQRRERISGVGGEDVKDIAASAIGGVMA